MATRKVLIVDDDQYWIGLLEECVVKLGYDVVSTTSGNKAIRILQTEDIDAVITDTKMADGDGWALLQMMWRTKKSPPTLIHSSENIHWTPGRIRIILNVEVPQVFGQFAQFAIKSPSTRTTVATFLGKI